MPSFMNLLCRIFISLAGATGLVLNVMVLAKLWHNKVRVGWSTYRIGMSFTAIHALIISLLAGPTCMIFTDIALFTLLMLFIGIWQFTPASCLLQYMALCKWVERKRIAISYSICTALMLPSLPYYTTFHAPPSQRPIFEETVRNIHEHDADDVFRAYGSFLYSTQRYAKACIDFAIYAVLPSYCIAYIIFVWCCVMISRILGSFGVKLSAKTINMQRSFLSMLLLQGLMPLILMSGPLGGFIIALIIDIAMDKKTLFISFSLWAMPVAQGAVALAFVNLMGISSTAKNRDTPKTARNTSSVIGTL